MGNMKMDEGEMERWMEGWQGKWIEGWKKERCRNAD